MANFGKMSDRPPLSCLNAMKSVHEEFITAKHKHNNQTGISSAMFTPSAIRVVTHVTLAVDQSFRYESRVV